MSGPVEEAEALTKAYSRLDAIGVKFVEEVGEEARNLVTSWSFKASFIGTAIDPSVERMCREHLVKLLGLMAEVIGPGAEKT